MNTGTAIHIHVASDKGTGYLQRDSESIEGWILTPNIALSSRWILENPAACTHFLLAIEKATKKWTVLVQEAATKITQKIQPYLTFPVINYTLEQVNSFDKEKAIQWCKKIQLEKQIEELQEQLKTLNSSISSKTT